MNKLYEGMFVFDANHAGKDWPGLEQHVSDLVQRHEGALVHTERWPDRKLAYEIKGCKKGTYYLTYFNAPTTAIQGLQRDCELSDRVLRAMFLYEEVLVEDCEKLKAREAAKAAEAEAKAAAAEAAEEAKAADEAVAETSGDDDDDDTDDDDTDGDDTDGDDTDGDDTDGDDTDGDDTDGDDTDGDDTDGDDTDGDDTDDDDTDDDDTEKASD